MSDKDESSNKKQKLDNNKCENATQERNLEEENVSGEIASNSVSIDACAGPSETSSQSRRGPGPSQDPVPEAEMEEEAIPEEFNSDVRLILWQETQIAECVIDNALNRVVESYFNILNELDEMDDTDSDLEMDERPENGFEESAILMAITEHGLQQSEDQETATSSAEPPDPPSANSSPDFDFMEAAVSTAIQKKGLSSNR